MIGLSVIPKVHPIDIQSTDAGPGVGTSEKKVKIRMTETFILGDLDLIAHFHYAPRYSICYVVECVMSRLNGAAGDGNPISVNYPEESMEATNISEKHKEAMKEQAVLKDMCIACVTKVQGSTLYGHNNTFLCT